MNAYIYLRALKHAEHTVFCVEKGQKTYYDPQFNRWLAYSSGQQVKRSILDTLTSNLNVQMAPITFNYEIVSKKDKKELQQKEVWSPCNPIFVDQLVGGWMRAKDKESSEAQESVLKRRSPLSISALRALHPLLAGVDFENMTFDRSNNPENNPVKVRMGGKLLTNEEIQKFLDDNNRTLTRRNWIANKNDSRGFGRAGGLFVYDIAVDLRTLFSVSTNQHEPELSKDKIEDLLAKGWIESENVFGKCLVLPKEERLKVIPALASALLNWRITSNQSRTFSLMETLAVAISDNANKLAGAIRAKLIEDGEKPKAKPIIDETAGADVFVALPCSNYLVTVNESSDALEKAEQRLVDLMSDFDYENQLG